MPSPRFEVITSARDESEVKELKQDPRTGIARYEGTSTSDLLTIPTSVRQHLEKAHSLAKQDRPAEAAQMFRTAGAELARSHPELFTALMLGSAGYAGISFIHTLEEPAYTGLGKLMALILGDDPDALQIIRQETKTIRLLKE